MSESSLSSEQSIDLAVAASQSIGRVVLATAVGKAADGSPMKSPMGEEDYLDDEAHHCSPATSQATLDKVKYTKLAIESFYSVMQKSMEQKIQRRRSFTEQLRDSGVTGDQEHALLQELAADEGNFLRLRRSRHNVDRYKTVKLIGKGSFGEVRLVQDRDESKDLFALKVLNKETLRARNQLLGARWERNLLASADSPWLVQLYSSFQDSERLYLLMEYVPGGDLLSLLQREDVLPESAARFMAAEIIQAISVVHSLGYIYRDLKPDNVVIDGKGHIKLTDFGLACPYDTESVDVQQFDGQSLVEGEDQAAGSTFRTSMNTLASRWRTKRGKAYSAVGTPDYMSPEVVGRQGHTHLTDIWSLGCVLYEMLVGYPPFFADDAATTCKKILRWKETLYIPPQAGLSAEAQDLIMSLLCEEDSRLSIAHIRAHPFFEGISWFDIREQPPPFVPQLDSPLDTRYFDEFEPAGSIRGAPVLSRRPCVGPADDEACFYDSDSQLPFVGFTFHRYRSSSKGKSRRPGAAEIFGDAHAASPSAQD